MEAAGADEEKATHPEKAAAYMAEAVLGFNEQLERILEVAMVVLLGGMLSLRTLPAEALWFVPLLLLVIRPAAVVLGLLGSRVSRYQRTLIGWFGIRGIGSIYYLMYAIEHGLPAHARPAARRPDADDRGRLDRRPRHLGDSPDEPLPLPCAEEEAAGIEGALRREPPESRPPSNSLSAGGPSGTCALLCSTPVQRRADCVEWGSAGVEGFPPR